MDRLSKNNYYQPNPWRFFVLALGLSWFFWIWIILFDWNIWTFPALLFGGLGLVGPAIAEVILIFNSHGKDSWEDYWRRIFDYRRIGKKWYLVIFFTFPLIHGLATLLSICFQTPLPEFETLKGLLSAPLTILPFTFFILVFGPFPEELGWRGYALDGLQARYNALKASFILGVMWALWHIPLFFMKGTFQHDYLKFGTVDFWTYSFGPIIISILFTWIYNNNNHSTFSAILFHFMINFTGEVISLNTLGRVFSILLITITVIIVILVSEPGTLIFNVNYKNRMTSKQYWKNIFYYKDFLH